MIPELRERFNREFTAEKYARFLSRLDQVSGTQVKFRVCESPIFIPRELQAKMERAGAELVHQLVGNATYHAASDVSIPAAYNVPRESAHPLFIQVDFGLVRDSAGELQPKLVELQGFPSLYAFQPALSQTYKEVYELGDELTNFSSELDAASYRELLCRVVLGGHDPEQVG